MIGDMLRWRLAGLRFGKVVAEMPIEGDGKGTVKLYKSNGTFTAVTDCGGKMQALVLKEISKVKDFAVEGIANSKTTQYVLATQKFKDVAAADIPDKKKFPYVHITYLEAFKVADKAYKAIGEGVLETSADTSYNFATPEETSEYQNYGFTQMAPGYRRSYARTPKPYGRSYAYGLNVPKFSGSESGSYPGYGNMSQAYGVDVKKFSRQESGAAPALAMVPPKFNTRKDPWAFQKSGQETFVDETGAIRKGDGRRAKRTMRGRGL